MSSTLPYLPPVLATVDEILTTGKIPALNGDEMEILCSHLFALRDHHQRMRIAEIAYGQRDSEALKIFLACTMPMAQSWSERKANILFVHPSDWQLECLYNGAVSGLLRMFHKDTELKSIPHAFRRYLLHSLAWGALKAYFNRDEYSRTVAVSNTDLIVPRGPSRNQVEQELITRELLEQITHYPLLQRALSKTLCCITELGPDLALKEHSSKKGNPNTMKAYRKLRPMLNPTTISEVRGIKPSVVLQQIHHARVILRKAFNGDGKLFQTR